MSHQAEIDALLAGDRQLADVRVLHAPLKLCKDCQFFIADGARCGHKSAVALDYVHGEHRHFAASTHRNWQSTKDCGPDGRHFVAVAS